MRQQTGSRSTGRDSSFAYLLAVWVLVGTPLCGLGMELVDVVPVEVPFSTIEAGALFATVLVASLWIAGVRPSLRASGVFFVVQLGLSFLLVVGSAFLLPPMTTLSPWGAVLVRSFSIALAAALAFTDLGRRVRDFVEEQGRRLAKAPPE